MEMIREMKTFELKRIMAALVFVSLFILQKRYFVFGELDSVHECLYKYFFYLGEKEERLNIRLVSDFLVYQCVFWLFMGRFFKEDILDNSYMILTRTNKRFNLYLKEIRKITIHAVVLYIYIYLFSALFCVKDKAVYIFDAAELKYFLIGLVLVCLYFAALNVGTIYVDIRYICIVFILAGFCINSYCVHKIFIWMVFCTTLLAAELIFINKKELIFWKQ